LTQQIELSFTKLGKALLALESMVEKPMQQDRSNIDACIQRFEFTIELFWKCLKRILVSLGEDVTYPKDVLKAAYQGKLIQDEHIWLQILKDRNQTSHTYDEELADKIYENIKSYFPVLKSTYKELNEKYNIASTV
jgi:nucleotidyltransferase substrate binding protein (TIGR01987 family)